MGELQTLLALVVLIYVLCVIVQAIQEIIKSVLDTKATTMAATIRQFMGDLLTVDQVQGALRQRGLDIAALEKFSKDDFRKLLDGIQFTSQQAALIPTVAVTAGADINELKDHIAASYEAARAKFQQSYTKHNKVWVIAISLVVVLALNASLIKIYGILSVDQKLSQAIAGTAPSLATSNQSNQKGSTAQSQTPADVFASNRKVIQEDLSKYPVLLRTGKYSEDLTHPLPEIAGLLLMWFLVSLGAPFWNDVLKGANGVNNALNSGGKKTS